ncbi:hypothetical protein GCM10027614_82600 [Micromonospora vulcania]
MSHLLRLPYTYFQTRGTGDLMARLSSNMTVRDMLTSQLVTIVLDTLFVLVYTALLVVVSPAYAAVVAVLTIAQIVIVLTTLRAVHERSQRELSVNAKAQSSAIDALAGAEFLKSSGLANWALRRWSDRFVESVQAGFQRRRLDLINESAMGMFQAAAPLVLLVFGIIQVVDGRMSLGTMLGLNVLAGLLLRPIGQVMGALRYLQTIGSHLERIYDVLNETPNPPARRPASRMSCMARSSCGGRLPVRQQRPAGPARHRPPDRTRHEGGHRRLDGFREDHPGAALHRPAPADRRDGAGGRASARRLRPGAVAPAVRSGHPVPVRLRRLDPGQSEPRSG